MTEMLRRIIHDLISAGIEAGSKRVICEHWDLDDVEAQRAAWKRNGPPPNLSLHVIAKALGADLTPRPDDGSDVSEVDLKPETSRLADLAQGVELPRAGSDTMAATIAILEKLKADRHE